MGPGLSGAILSVLPWSNPEAYMLGADLVGSALNPAL
jgi:hypothetical protein